MKETKQRTILVIDDDRSMRDLFKYLLEKEGYTVILAETAKRGVDLWQKNASKINLVITDFNFRGEDMTGADILALVKRDDPPMLVIGMSGIPEQLLGHMFATTWTKPFLAKDIKQDIKYLIG